MRTRHRERVLHLYLRHGDISINELVNKFRHVEALTIHNHTNFTDNDKLLCLGKDEEFKIDKCHYIPIFQVGTRYIIGWIKMRRIVRKTIAVITTIATIKYLQAVKQDYLNFINLVNNEGLMDNEELRKALREFRENGEIE